MKILTFCFFFDHLYDIIKASNTEQKVHGSKRKRLEADRAEKQILQEKIDYLTQKLFGTSSEKIKEVDGQLCLFDEAEQETGINLKSPVITIPEHTRKQKRTHEELFKGLPSRDEIISLLDDERICDTCGAALEVIGKEFVRHELRYTPAKGEVVNIYRETYKCPECSAADVMEENREFSSAQSFLSMNADHRSKIFLLNKGKHIVSKKRSQYSMHSGRGWSNNDHAKGPASRRR